MRRLLVLAIPGALAISCAAGPPASARHCVLDAIGALKFPKPARGVVTLIYPILFAPGG